MTAAHRIFKIFSWIGIVFIILLAIFYIWGSLNIPRIEGELSYQNSSDYQFYQHPITRYITIKKDGEALYDFFFKSHVFAVWLDETRPYVFLVTSDTGALKGAHGLYIYNGQQIEKVYQSRTIEFESGVKNASYLYSPWLDLYSYENNFDRNINLKKTTMNNRFNISPDGHYLFGYESGYEGGVGFVIDLLSMEKSELQLSDSSLFWSPSGECAISYDYGYGYDHLQLAYYENGILKVRDYDKNFFTSEFDGVYWIDNCAGIVAVKSDTNDIIYYKLDVNTEHLQLVPSFEIEKLKKSTEYKWPLQNIFFTILDPNKK